MANRINHLTLTGLVSGVALLHSCSAGAVPAKQSKKSESKQPNLIFIFSDQQSWDMLGCYGNEQLITPRLDKMASEGVMFNYCISINPVSVPNRAMLLTGTHALRNGALTNDIRPDVTNTTTFAQALQNEGYRTCYIGKWHLFGGNRDRAVTPDQWLGFDEMYTNNCTLNFMPEHAFFFGSDGNKVKFNDWEAYGQAQQAVDFINRQPDDRPFALFVSFHPPHDQGASRSALRYKTIADLMNLYDPAAITLRPNVEEYPGADWGSTFEETRADYHGYYAMCTGIDIACGRIFDALENKKRDDNTLVVYTSDHGDLLKSHGRPWAKSFPEDESVRVPLLMKFPGKLQPRTSDLLVGTLDLMPTLLALMDIKVPKSCDGRNLSKAILTRDDNAVKSVPLFYFLPDWRGVFTKEYTYAFDLLEERDKESWNVLYDRKEGQYKMQNRYYDKNYRKIRQEMHDLALQWLDHYNDPLQNSRKTLELCGIPDLQLDKQGAGGILTQSPYDMFRREGIQPVRPTVPDDATEAIWLKRYNDRKEKRIADIAAEKAAGGPTAIKRR